MDTELRKNVKNDFKKHFFNTVFRKTIESVRISSLQKLKQEGIIRCQNQIIIQKF